MQLVNVLEQQEKRNAMFVVMSDCLGDSMLTLHEDTFYEFFRPYRHPQAGCDIWGGIGLKTYDDDLELVKSLSVTNVWTVVDGDDGDQ